MVGLNPVIYIHIHINTYVYIYTYIFIYTHTNIYIKYEWSKYLNWMVEILIQLKTPN